VYHTNQLKLELPGCHKSPETYVKKPWFNSKFATTETNIKDFLNEKAFHQLFQRLMSTTKMRRPQLSLPLTPAAPAFLATASPPGDGGWDVSSLKGSQFMISRPYHLGKPIKNTYNSFIQYTVCVI